MPLLILVSLIWAFSFGLIKGRLAGLDATGVAVVRLLIASAVFAPFLQWRGVRPAVIFPLAAIGAIQFGAMYIFYLEAFAHLHAFEVALFTIFTPLYLTLLEAVAERSLNWHYLGAALLAIVGAALILWTPVRPEGLLNGFLLVQGSNLAFAVGQFAYRRLRGKVKVTSEASVFGWLYLGALAATSVASLITTDWSGFRPNGEQWLTLVYLGAIASGAGFFLWNVGATQVNAGLLAVFNNAKVPLGVACSLVFFGEQADLVKLALSLVLLGIALAWSEQGKRGRV